jgi:hypothetical protein
VQSYTQILVNFIKIEGWLTAFSLSFSDDMDVQLMKPIVFEGWNELKSLNCCEFESISRSSWTLEGKLSADRVIEMSVSAEEAALW